MMNMASKIKLNLKPQGKRKKLRQTVNIEKELRDIVLRLANANNRTISSEIAFRLKRNLQDEGFISKE